MIFIDDLKDIRSVVEIAKEDVFFFPMMQPIGAGANEVDTIFDHPALFLRSEVEVFHEAGDQRQPALDQFVLIDKHLHRSGIACFFRMCPVTGGVDRDGYISFGIYLGFDAAHQFLFRIPGQFVDLENILQLTDAYGAGAAADAVLLEYFFNCGEFRDDALDSSVCICFHGRPPFFAVVSELVACRMW